MDFLVEFIRTLFNFLLLVGCAIGGVFIGKGLRARKNNKNAAEASEE